MAAQVPLRLLIFDQLLEWQLLVHVSLKADLSDLLNQFVDARVATEIPAQHERIHEDADQRLPLEVGPPGGRGAIEDDQARDGRGAAAEASQPDPA